MKVSKLFVWGFVGGWLGLMTLPGIIGAIAIYPAILSFDTTHVLTGYDLSLAKTVAQYGLFSGIAGMAAGAVWGLKLQRRRGVCITASAH